MNIVHDYIMKCINCGNKLHRKDIKCCSLSCASQLNWKLGKIGFQKGHKRRVGVKHPTNFIENRKKTGNPYWKGDNASISSIHCWVRNNFIKTGICEHCNLCKKTEWSNKYHTYKRDRIDWQELCRSCHQKYDCSNGLRHISKNFLEYRIKMGYIISTSRNGGFVAP